VAAEQAGDVAALCRVGDARASDVAQALELYAAHPRLTARDAFFAAFALARGIGVILSPDRDFDEVPGLQRVDPSDEQAVDALVAP
jgi:predicted nucleic acid-binding protein